MSLNGAYVTDTDWLTPAQAARVLGVTPAMVRYWADRGQLDCQRTALGRLIAAESAMRLHQQRSVTRGAARGVKS